MHEHHISPSQYQATGIERGIATDKGGSESRTRGTQGEKGNAAPGRRRLMRHGGPNRAFPGVEGHVSVAEFSRLRAALHGGAGGVGGESDSGGVEEAGSLFRRAG